jgi:hypothetical protein
MDAMDFSCAAPAQTAKKTTGELEYDWFCVDGGSDHISKRMAERIRVQPKMGHRVTKIYSEASSTMQVEHKSSGTSTKLLLPFSLLMHICGFSWDSSGYVRPGHLHRSAWVHLGY